MKRNILFVLVGSIVMFSCSSSSTQEISNSNESSGENPVSTNEWSIPVSEVLDGGPGKDGIPALENPNFVEADNASYVNDDDLVIGFKSGNDVRAYPHSILDWHEIVNDNIGGVSLAVTYCPLTGTGIGWNRVLNGQETTFGVSGLLYNTNLIPYDRSTGSNWSQILNEAVNGSLIGEKVDLVPLVETDWATWKQLYPNTKVIDKNTGFSRTYGITPYGDYSTNHNRFLFPVDKDPRLPSKERVLALVDGADAKVYRFDVFVDGDHIIKDTFKNKVYLLVGSTNFMVAYRLTDQEDALTFEYSYDGSSEVILKDNEGNLWNLFGEAVSGPRSGQRLEAASSFMGFWFSIPAFYNTVIYDN